VQARQGSRRVPGQSNDIYDNGPINGNADAWDINFGFVVSDTFTIPSSGNTVTGMSFGAWLFPGDTLTSAELSITSGENGGTSYFDQAVDFSQGSCTSNEYGYNVCTVSTSFNGPNLNPGTYWVNLQNASVPSGDPVYWDENSGVGCQSDGCPSQASENDVGTIPSESFSMLGNSEPPTCPEYQGNLRIIHSFAQPQAGASGPSGITIHNAENLYETTYIGGDNGADFAYRLARSGDSTLAATQWREKVLHSFGSGADGKQPDYGGLILDGAGNLYGATEYGGAHGCGTVFELSPSEGGGWTETVLHSFNNNGTDGWYPLTGLIFDAAGNLYGTTLYGQGYGAVFELSPSEGGGWTEKVLYNFTGAYNGRYANGLTFDSAGNLYGTTSGGGLYCSLYGGCGTVFELSPTGGGSVTERVLHSFGSGTDGSTPSAPLIFDAAGNLYGTTNAGGAAGGEGTVFELSPTGGGNWTETVLYSFGPLPDGAEPWTGALTFDSAGNLYGTTAAGGTNRDGTVFELSPTAGGGWTEQVLHDFGNGTDGFEPFGGLIIDAAGNLYGTTTQGGLEGEGTVFELAPSGGGWTETLLYSFVNNGTDGTYPLAGLTFDSAGNLYGTTGLSGTNGYGTAFELTPVYPCARCSHSVGREVHVFPAETRNALKQQR
jgi:uncharacterized repeat protein (TIGR03803 family)